MYKPKRGDIVMIIKLHRKEYSKNRLLSGRLFKLTTDGWLSYKDENYGYYAFKATSYAVDNPKLHIFNASAVENIHTGEHSISPDSAPSWLKRFIKRK